MKTALLPILEEMLVMSKIYEILFIFVLPTGIVRKIYYFFNPL